MHVKQWLQSLLTVDDSILDEDFALLGTSSDNQSKQDSAQAANGSSSQSQTEDKSNKPQDSQGQAQGAAEGPNQGASQGSRQGATKQGPKGDNSDRVGQNAQGTAKQNAQGGAEDPGQSTAQQDAKGDKSDQQDAQGDKSNRSDRSGHKAPSAGNSTRSRRSTKPKTLSQYIEETEKSKDAPVSDAALENKDELDGDMDRTKAILKAVFHIPPNADFVIREFTVGTERPWRALAIFIDGMSDKTTINEHILEPLMMISTLLDENPERRMDGIVKTLLPGNQIEIKSKWMEIINGIITGSTAVFIEGCKDAAIVETKSWEHRSVSQPATEQVVRGAHDAFTESFRANTALVRSRLRSENLVTEMEAVGSVAKTDVAVMYIAGLTNSKLVKEVKRRLDAVDVDFLEDSGMLEQFLEDRPKSMIPQMMSSERPDRIAQMLMEGHVAIFVGQNPYVIVAPTTLWSLVHSGEDSYLKFPFGNFVRLIRWIALVAAIILPAVYVAVTNYHAEMLPTDLMLAIAASREQVPFPVIMEVLLMEFALELIREAGIRIPSVIGPTIGIVGALIIGQSAVQAGLVSPLLVIIVAVTALASFTVPNYNLSLAVRILRFIFMFAAAFFGFYGIALLWTFMTVKLATTKSFGVPFLSPVAPPSDSSMDVFLRGPAYAMNERPEFLHAQKRSRQQPVTRPWSPQTHQIARQKTNQGKEEEK